MVKLPFYEAVNSTYPHNAHSMAILYAHEKYRDTNRGLGYGKYGL